MGSRVIEFNVTIETSTLPDAGDPTTDPEVLTKGYADSTYHKKRQSPVGNAYGTPQVLAAGDSIAHGLGVKDDWAIVYVAGNGGPVDLISANQIAIPTRIGQMVSVVGTSDVNTVKLEHGSGLDQNGEKILGAKKMITYIAFSLTEWVEFGRP